MFFDPSGDNFHRFGIERNGAGGVDQLFVSSHLTDLFFRVKREGDIRHCASQPSVSRIPGGTHLNIRSNSSGRLRRVNDRVRRGAHFALCEADYGGRVDVES